MLDLEPVLLTVVALATEGRLSSFMGKPMLSSLVLVAGRNPGDDDETSSFESLKKLLQTLLAILTPLGGLAQGRDLGIGARSGGGVSRYRRHSASRSLQDSQLFSVMSKGVGRGIVPIGRLARFVRGVLWRRSWGDGARRYLGLPVDTT